MTFSTLVAVLVDIINRGIVLLIAVTFVVFLWGIARAWIFSGGDQAAIDSGKKIATAGIIALVVVIGIWGIISILRRGIFGL